MSKIVAFVDIENNEFHKEMEVIFLLKINQNCLKLYITNL
jgi:hypothetical protein